MRRGGSGRSKTCNRPRARQCLANCIARKIVDQLRTPEAHFDFGRVHVDVDFGVGHLQEKQRRGKDARRQDVAIGLVNGVQNQPVTHQAPVYKNVDPIAIHPLYVGTRGKPTHRQR